jgi:MtN3 and saliva related transmembrane protein
MEWLASALLGGHRASEREPDRQSAVTRTREPSVTDALGIAAAAWGVLMAISPLLQIRRIFERRSSADVSVAYLAVLQIGFMLWVGYGFALGNLAIVVPNSVAFLVGVATILIALQFRRPAAETIGD